MDHVEKRILEIIEENRAALLNLAETSFIMRSWATKNFTPVKNLRKR